jgi:hypothetical protein
MGCDQRKKGSIIMTRKEFYEAVANGSEITEDMRTRAKIFLETLAKEAERKTPKQRENELIKDRIVEYLTEVGSYETAQQIADGMSTEEVTYSRSKVSSLCGQLIKEERIKTIAVKVKGSLKQAYGVEA